MSIQNRYEFVLFFDVENGNPNGDPDAGNLPRVDPETGLGLVSDVCLKRKVRNYVELTRIGAPGYRIYVQEKAVLNERNEEAYLAIDEKPSKKMPKGKEQQLTEFMCKNFYDIRTFGAVMSTEVNCGQVRGPVQICFARSVDPIQTQEITITRMAVTNVRDLEKERTMGRKSIVPYGLYRVEGFISAALAEKTGFSDEDLDLLWEALANMFEHDHSAARGKMVSRKLIAFKHASKLGNAPSHVLFDSVTVDRKDSTRPPRHFSDYAISIDRTRIPEQVQILELV
jgi:CRISPR-associated protein Csd2